MTRHMGVQLACDEVALGPCRPREAGGVRRRAGRPRRHQRPRRARPRAVTHAVRAGPHLWRGRVASKELEEEGEGRRPGGGGRGYSLRSGGDEKLLQEAVLQVQLESRWDCGMIMAERYKSDGYELLQTWPLIGAEIAPHLGL